MLANVSQPICQYRILERENNDICDSLDRGEDIGNRRHFYNSPACEIDKVLMSYIEDEQIWIIANWDRSQKSAILEAAGI